MKRFNQQEFNKIWPKIVAKTWTDPAFKKKLLIHPHEALAEYGIQIEPDYTIEIHENKQKSLHLTLPAPNGALSEKQLENINAGVLCCFSCNS